MKRLLPIYFSFLLSHFSLSLSPAGAQTHTIRTDAPRQTIQHFGASDAWSMQTIGLWPDTAAQVQIADWLFSLDTIPAPSNSPSFGGGRGEVVGQGEVVGRGEVGQPLGIGLSLWRFNLGAGSAEQGRESQTTPVVTAR